MWLIGVLTIVVSLVRLCMTMDFTPVVVCIVVVTVGVQMHVERGRCVDGQRQAHTEHQAEAEHFRPIFADKAPTSQIALTQRPS